MFDVKVKEVAKPIRPELNDDFAKTLGAESLDKLKELVSSKIASEYASITRMRLKQQILDALDKAHDFPLPETLVTNEFDGIWKQLTQSLEQAGRSFADEGKSEDELKAEYRKIAERRVRLGLVIGEIGEKSGLQVSQEELRRALIEQARRYPGQEKFVYEFYEKNPAALIELRAPIFEDKVIDHILGQANADREEGDGRGADQVGGCGRRARPWPRPCASRSCTTMGTITAMTMTTTTMVTTMAMTTTMGTTTVTTMSTITTMITAPEKK